MHSGRRNWNSGKKRWNKIDVLHKIIIHLWYTKPEKRFSGFFTV